VIQEIWMEVQNYAGFRKKFRLKQLEALYIRDSGHLRHLALYMKK